MLEGRGGEREREGRGGGGGRSCFLVVNTLSWDFGTTIPNPTRPQVADSGIPYKYIG